MWGLLTTGEKLSPSFCPTCQYIRRNPVGKRYCTTDCPWALGYTVWNGIGWLLDTQVQIVGLTVFCLGRPNGSTPNGTQHNMGWQICTVTAGSWLGHQNVSFQAGPSPPHGGGSGLVKTRGVLTFLITGQGTAAVDSLSIDLASAWLQN